MVVALFLEELVSAVALAWVVVLVVEPFLGVLGLELVLVVVWVWVVV